MYHETARTLTFEALLTDPLTRLVMDADGVTVAELAAVLRAAGDAVCARENLVLIPVLPMPVAIGAWA